MNPLHATVLGAIQGLTEVLPISSSAHLILVPWLFGWPESGITFDVALHLGTLIALALYFRRDIAELAMNALAGLTGGDAPPPPASPGTSLPAAFPPPSSVRPSKSRSKPFFAPTPPSSPHS